MTSAQAHAVLGIQPPGYRLPGTTRLGRVRLQIADLERSLAFYNDVLGFRTLEQSDNRAALGASDADSTLVELVERPGARSVPRRGRLGLYHIAYLLPERAALARFVRHLADTGVPAGMSDHLVSEAIYLADPDGLGIEVYADRPRSTWRQDGKQIVMATKPLDVRDLLQAAGNEAWTGAPAGTVVGHIHLHVSDLDRAASLYHSALGLDKVVWDYPGALFLSAGGYHHHLGLNTWASGAAPAGDDDARLIEWTLVLPETADADAAARSLEKAEFVIRPGEQDHLVDDPWGTTLRLKAAT